MNESYRQTDENTVEKTTGETVDLRPIRERIEHLEEELAQCDEVPEILDRREYEARWSKTGLTYEQAEYAVLMLRERGPRAQIERELTVQQDKLRTLLEKCKNYGGR